MNIEQIKEVMKNICTETGLPMAYQEDVQLDLKQVEQYLDAGFDCIWLLRSYGSALVPVRAGSGPIHIEYWCEPDRRAYHGQRVEAFVISKMGVSAIAHDQALKLIRQKPGNLSACNNENDVLRAVDKVIKAGSKLKLWGVFEVITENHYQGMNEWLRYFNKAENEVMVEYLKDAISLSKKFVNAS